MKTDTTKTDNTIPFKPVSPAYAHAGGKTRLLRHILPRIPADHRVYVEPFCGGCAVLLGKLRSHLEVINDADGDLITFLRYAQFHPDALISELNRWPGNSRGNFAALLQNRGYTDLQRAVRWYLVKVSSFGAKSEAYGRARTEYHGYDPARNPALISRLSERLKRVQIESGDWESVAEFHDGPGTLFFFDPPYVACARTSYEPFTKGDMRRVRDFLSRCKGRWLLTVDDSPECREIFAGFPCESMSIRYSIGGNRVLGKVSGELLIFHPALAPSGAEILSFSDGLRTVQGLVA